MRRRSEAFGGRRVDEGRVAALMGPMKETGVYSGRCADIVGC